MGSGSFSATGSPVSTSISALTSGAGQTRARRRSLIGYQVPMWRSARPVAVCTSGVSRRNSPGDGTGTTRSTALAGTSPSPVGATGPAGYRTWPDSSRGASCRCGKRPRPVTGSPPWNSSVTTSPPRSRAASRCGTWPRLQAGCSLFWPRSLSWHHRSKWVTSLTRSRSGVLLGGQAPPRVRSAPRVRANSWEDVADLSASLGVKLDEWQENVLEAAMGERADGRWAARLVGVSTPRQNGKSQLIVARALAGVLLFDEQTIIVSAHQTDTAREVFQRLLDIIEANPGLERRVDSVMKAINREHIRFKTGQVIRIKARSIAGGRGFSCDCLLLDEAQILGAAAWATILPTMSARPNPQAWLLGTPPTPDDDGEVFTRLRRQVLR